MDLGFSALCIVLRKTCMACIAAPETYEESHWCISTASYRRWRSCGSRGTTQVPIIPWWEYARTLTQQNADLKSDLNVQQISQWWKKHSKCGFSHLVLPSFWQSEGRENLLVEYAMWTHLDTSPSSHRSACFDPAAATVQQKLSFDVGIFRCSQGVSNMTWVGCWHFFCEDVKMNLKAFDSLWVFFGGGYPALFFCSKFSREELHVLLHSSLRRPINRENPRVFPVNLVGHLQATKIGGQVTPSTSRK